MIRRVEIEIPPEPYHLGVVTDRDGLAWQRRDGSFVGAWGDDAYPVRWNAANEIGPEGQWSVMPWPALIATRGPLEVHYEGSTR